MVKDQSEIQNPKSEIGASEIVNILIVDDKVENLLALETVLGPLGCNLVRATSGREALRRLIRQEYALILLDIHMPDMDGLETAQLIRGREQNKDVPIIFITAEYTDLEHISRGYALNAIDYMLKPFDPEILRAKVGVLVELYQKTRQIQEQAEALRQSELHLEDLVRQRTAQLETYAAKLEMSNRDLQEFAYIASHDLQEPLRKVQAFSDRLATRYTDALDETGRDYLERMRDASQRMQTLINALLDFSRLSSRAQPFTEVNLNTVAKEALSSLENQIERTKGRVEIGDLPALEADPSQMRQLLQNLISNGLKFHQDGIPPIVQLSAQVEDGECRLSITDNGIGFDIQYLDRIFKPFQRLHNREEFEGSGMGLAICRRIAERHGGSITAASASGQGTTFLVTLPLHGSQGDK